MKKQQDHDYALEKVPAGGKKGFFSMFVIMLGFTFFSASILTGGNLGAGLNFNKFVTAVIMGNLILGVYSGALAYIGAKTGLSMHLLSRYSFGKKGSYLASFLVSITQMGWFGVGIAMFAIPVSKVTGINVWVLVILAGFLMTSSAYFGIKALTILSAFAVPAITFLGLMSVFKAVDTAGGMSSITNLQPVEPITMMLAITLCVGSFISGATMTPDFSRFAKTKKTAIITTFVAFFIGNSLMFVFGAVGVSVYGQPDIFEVMKLQGLIIPAILILGLSIWSTSDNGLYTSGLGFSNITGLPKKKLVLVCGAVGTLGSLWLYSNFQSWLIFLGSAIPPVGGIIIADYFLNKEKYRNFEKTSFKTVNISAIAACLLGMVSGMFLPGIAPINAILVGGISYVVLDKLIPGKETVVIRDGKSIA